ncbi:hypothetical protein PPTG_22160 [Phytophthora nicotianae INRA-310]|uniref:Uncharacterized protein n=1 Tax=Phytophthora nicotianae (strain INRA-310) TaxID=761204 RepID=W2QN22_PHYN3|nr:hypothetical protein PPTG_22160 [Phytophthora nicotianae INRA-310]ETN14597.1 hypothetical protein PPTG_22160 [Phytophthora nicotianae INRA-310]
MVTASCEEDHHEQRSRITSEGEAVAGHDMTILLAFKIRVRSTRC